MKLVYLHLAGSYMRGWNYRENLLPTYFLDYFDNITILTSQFVVDNESGKLVKANDNFLHENGINIRRLQFNFTFLPLAIYSRIRLYKNFYNELEMISPTHVYVNGLQFLSLLDLVKFSRKFPHVKIIGEQNAYFGKSANSLFSRILLHGFFYRIIINLAKPIFKKIYMGSEAARDFSHKNYGFGFSHEIITLGYDSKLVNNVSSINKLILREKYGIPKDKIVLSCGGKIDSDKKVVELLIAFNRINIDKLYLIVFGSIFENFKTDIFNQISKSYNIKFIGWLDQITMFEIFYLCDIVIFPGTKSSIWETAVSTGTPIIAQYWEGLNYFDFGGNVEYLYGKGDVDEIVMSIKKNVLDSNNLEKLSNSARKSNKETLSYETIAKKIYLDFESEVPQ